MRQETVKRPIELLRPLEGRGKRLPGTYLRALNLRLGQLGGTIEAIRFRVQRDLLLGGWS